MKNVICTMSFPHWQSTFFDGWNYFSFFVKIIDYIKKFQKISIFFKIVIDKFRIYAYNIVV